MKKLKNSGTEELRKPEPIMHLDQFIQLIAEFERIQRKHLTREDEGFSLRIKEMLTVKQIGHKMAKQRHLTG